MNYRRGGSKLKLGGWMETGTVSLTSDITLHSNRIDSTLPDSWRAQPISIAWNQTFVNSDAFPSSGTGALAGVESFGESSNLLGQDRARSTKDQQKHKSQQPPCGN